MTLVGVDVYVAVLVVIHELLYLNFARFIWQFYYVLIVAVSGFIDFILLYYDRYYFIICAACAIFCFLLKMCIFTDYCVGTQVFSP